MKPLFRFTLLLVAWALAVRAQTASDPRPPGQAEVKAYDAAQQQRLKWFTEARLGMFIHWGLYAVPAGQWPGRESKERAEWIMLQENIPSADYEDLARVFNPVKFDAKAWVAVAQAAGMKYIVITAKHHDGFAMYDSKVSPYNIVAATPFKRDPLRELAAACHEAGIVFCVYYSTADWHHPEFPAQYSQALRSLPSWSTKKGGFHGAPNPNADVAKYADYMRAQVRELLTGYGPVGIVWFDGGGAFRVPNRAELCKGDELAAMIHALQPDCLINNRLGVAADYGTPEQRIPGGRTVEPFEVCMTLNAHWGYNRFDDKWKSPTTVVRNIADIVSKGGNYLLNVGPTAEGEIPAEGIRILKEVGAWTTLNAVAIHGAGPTPFGSELGYEDSEKKDKEGKPLWVDRDDWRCTTQPGKLFFTLLNWPTTTDKFGSGSKQLAFELPHSFSNKVTRAYFLCDKEHQLPVRRIHDDQVYPWTSVLLPAAAPTALAPVLCVEFEGEIAPSAAREKLDSKKDKES